MCVCTTGTGTGTDTGTGTICAVAENSFEPNRDFEHCSVIIQHSQFNIDIDIDTVVY